MPTLKEIRQRLGWAEDQLLNFLAKAGGVEADTPPSDSALYHVRTARAGLEEHIGAEDTSEDTTDDTTDDTTEPEPTGAEPAIVFDPDQYTSTEELIDDPEGVFDPRLDLSPEHIHLDSLGMRYDYVDHPEDGCGARSVGRKMDLPERAQDVWVEFEVRFSDNFIVKNSACDGPGDFKMLFAAVRPDLNGRFSFMGARGLRFGSPRGAVASPDGITVDHGDDGRQIDAFVEEGVQKARVQSFGVDVENELFDGDWHTIRLHFRASTDSTTYDAVMEAWMDGVYLGGMTGFAHNEVEIAHLLPGRNKDEGQAGDTESLWWRSIQAWDQDPGW